MKKPILAALALCYALGAAAQTPDTAAPEGYRFTDPSSSEQFTMMQ